MEHGVLDLHIRYHGIRNDVNRSLFQGEGDRLYAEMHRQSLLHRLLWENEVQSFLQHEKWHGLPRSLFYSATYAVESVAAPLLVLLSNLFTIFAFAVDKDGNGPNKADAEVDFYTAIALTGGSLAVQMLASGVEWHHRVHALKYWLELFVRRYLRLLWVINIALKRHQELVGARRRRGRAASLP